MSEAAIRRATTADVPALVGVLSRAFHDDPFHDWLLPAGSRRAAASSALFQLLLGQMSDGLRDTFVTSTPAGGVVWLRPGAHELSLWREAQLLPGFVRVLGLGRIPRSLRLLGHLEALHARFAPEPHVFLSLLGVEPAAQGRGHGSQLLQPMLQFCDSARLRVYLETANGRNVAFYQRHGFELCAETAHPEYPTYWSMTRAPR
jgi:ribosomal protein S18 acetylase RimI-like enzyme